MNKQAKIARQLARQQKAARRAFESGATTQKSAKSGK
jgi:hypothetical protein